MMTWLIEEGAFILDRVRVWMGGGVVLCSTTRNTLSRHRITGFHIYNKPPHTFLEYSYAFFSTILKKSEIIFLVLVI